MTELAGEHAGPFVTELLREYSIGENLPIVSRRNQNLPDLKSSPFIFLLDTEAFKQTRSFRLREYQNATPAKISGINLNAMPTYEEQCGTRHLSP